MLRRVFERVTRNWALKLTALVLAVLLWSFVQEAVDDAPPRDLTGSNALLQRVPVQDVPVEVVSRDPEWVQVGLPAPPTVTLVVSGTAYEVVRFARERPRVVLEVDEVRDTVETRLLGGASVRIDGDDREVQIEEVRPSTAEISYERFASRLVPVAVRTRGRVAQGLVLATPPRSDPRSVRISGPVGEVNRHDSVPLEPLDLSGIRGSGSRSVAVDTSGLDAIVVEPLEVVVHIQVEPVLAEPFPPPPPPNLDTVAPQDTGQLRTDTVGQTSGVLTTEGTEKSQRRWMSDRPLCEPSVCSVPSVVKSSGRVLELDR